MANKFAERLKWLLAENSISQKTLAEKTQLGTATISQWINGKRQPSADYILLIANYFGVTTDYLLGNTQDYDK